MQICTYPRRDLCLALTPPHLLSIYPFLSFLRALFVLAPSCHRATPEPRTNNQVDVEQRTSLSLTPSLSLSSSIIVPFSHPASPFLSIHVCKSLRRLYVLYVHRPTYLHDNIIPFLAYVEIGYPFSFLVLRRFGYHTSSMLVSNSSYFVIFLRVPF